jgi:hypothetical protein
MFDLVHAPSFLIYSDKHIRQTPNFCFVPFGGWDPNMQSAPEHSGHGPSVTASNRSWQSLQKCVIPKQKYVAGLQQ